MKKYEAIGVVEAQYFTTAMELLDQMCKSADIEFLTSEKYLGGRLVTLIIGGSVSDVTVAVSVAEQTAKAMEKNPLKSALVITNPHAEIMKYIVPSKLADEPIEKPVVNEHIDVNGVVLSVPEVKKEKAIVQVDTTDKISNKKSKKKKTNDKK
jgi:ethanolamine utilization protein EutM